MTKPKKPLPAELRNALSILGGMGGRAGAGKPKKRPPGYYAEIGKKGAEARKAIRETAARKK